MTDTLLSLSTPRCRIAPLHADDAAALAAITDDSVTSQVHFLPTPFTLADACALIARSGGGDVFHAVRDADSALIGVIGVHRLASREYEVGYWFAARARGQGIATEAVGALVRSLAEGQPDATIIAECHPDNGRSRALLRRIGFAVTGRPGRRPGRMRMTWLPAPVDRIDVC
ncbi:GNAT family N-acetyltransferase [Sphingopyxis sp. MWB1]|uniref:GNAT family N-acetyltransferase n=1 Tax=Sphingopyxis sp. MWB1 TaxID=1537715 RepID=UPI00051A1636|nr:GNAT family N-acetyltransferase [Sphingopyxis sp. MWB1]